MNARLQGFLSFLDLLAEGDSRRVELIAGRRLEPELELRPAFAPAKKIVKFPLTGHQKGRLFAGAERQRVSIEH